MKRLITKWALTIMVVISSSLAAQTEGVSIKTTVGPPHQSAMLDVESTTKGLLIPRISLTAVGSASPVNSPATGLLVYNTNSTLTGGVGFYYWNGSMWVQLAAGNGANQWVPGPVNTSANIYRPSGAVQVGTVNSTYTSVDNTAGYFNYAPGLFYAGGSTLSTTPAYTTIPGIHLGEPLDGLGGHWNEINTRGTYLDMQFSNGENVSMGAWSGSNLYVSKGYNTPSSGKGNIVAEGTVSAVYFNTTSDSTMKKNINTVDSVLYKLSGCNVYKYNYKTESDTVTKHFGVIAQQIATQFPELVRNVTVTNTTSHKLQSDQTAQTKTYKAVDYGALAAILLKAVKEQQAQIEALKARVTALENR